MNLHHLKVFLAVAQAGSVSRGAETLHISQPAVTREIRDLEASLGLALFDRHPRGVTPTAVTPRPAGADKGTAMVQARPAVSNVAPPP